MLSQKSGPALAGPAAPATTALINIGPNSVVGIQKFEVI